jgi:hypothetical protein
MRAYSACNPAVIIRCNRFGMLNNLDPASALAVALLIFCFVMVILFEATNGFHDAANAVATVIYTKSLAPVQAVVLSGLLNFSGVLLGGIAVAYALVELIPAEVLSPPDGGPAVGMLVALFAAALFWNIGTWWLALPNSSSHCLIGSLIGVAVGNAFARSRSLAEGVHWPQLWKVLEALALSPVLGRRAHRYRRLHRTAREHHAHRHLRNRRHHGGRRRRTSLRDDPAHRPGLGAHAAGDPIGRGRVVLPAGEPEVLKGRRAANIHVRKWRVFGPGSG